MLPLCIRGSYDIDDLGRIEILMRTLTAFSDPDMFGTFLVVTPPEEVDLVTEKCLKWPQFNMQVLSEEALVPELANYRHIRGWRKQQIVKLAVARIMPEKFYMTFDADVICLKPICYDDLIVDGRAILQYEMRAQHPKWWKASARILGMDPNIGDPTIGMTVTPSILATDLSKQLAEELTPPGGGSWVDVLGSLHNLKNPANWRLSRFLKLRWTEYSLYYLCALKRGVLDSYHVRTGTSEIPQLLLVHESHPFENWDAAQSFSADSPGLFCVVGSKSGLEPQVVWEKIKDFVPEEIR